MFGKSCIFSPVQPCLQERGALTVEIERHARCDGVGTVVVGGSADHRGLQIVSVQLPRLYRGTRYRVGQSVGGVVKLLRDVSPPDRRGVGNT